MIDIAKIVHKEPTKKTGTDIHGEKGNLLGGTAVEIWEDLPFNTKIIAIYHLYMTEECFIGYVYPKIHSVTSILIRRGKPFNIRKKYRVENEPLDVAISESRNGNREAANKKKEDDLFREIDRLYNDNSIVLEHLYKRSKK